MTNLIRDYVEVSFPARAGMVATLTGSITLIAVSYVAVMAGYSPSPTATTGLATTTIVVG